MLERLDEWPMLVLSYLVLGGLVGVMCQFLQNLLLKGLSQKFCQKCWCVIHAKMEICPRCGVRQVAVFPSGRNRLVAALFAFLLGFIGIHKIYLRKYGQEILYYLCAITLVPLVISLIEGFVYLSMTDKEFAAKYGKV